MKIPSGNAGQRKDLISKVESLHPYTHRTQRAVCTDNPSDGKTQETLGSPMLAKCQANVSISNKRQKVPWDGAQRLFSYLHTIPHMCPLSHKCTFYTWSFKFKK